MIRTHRFLAIVLLASAVVPTRAVLAQGLTAQEFEGRRRELRQQYLEARTPEAKHQVLERFRQLELRMQPGTRAERESLDRLFPGEDRRVVDALAAAGNVQGGSRTSGSPRSTGLGSGGETRPDPRLAELARLVAASEWELSEGLTPEYQWLIGDHTPVAPGSRETLGDVSREPIQTYLDHRRELTVRLRAGRAELANLRAGRASSWPPSLDDWTHVLGETGAGRRLLADWLRTRWNARIASDLANLRRLRASLVRDRASLERIQAAMTNGQSVQDLANLTMTLGHLIELSQGVSSAAENLAELPGTVLNEIYQILEPSNDITEEGFRRLSDFQVRRTAELEGFADRQDALRRIDSTLREIRGATEALRTDADRLQRNREIGNVPILPVR